MKILDFFAKSKGPGAASRGAGQLGVTARHSAKGIAYVASLSDLEADVTGHAVLAGELVGVSIDRAAESSFPELTHQPDLVLRSGQRLYAWVSPRVLSHPMAKQATLMFDQMAEYCLDQKEDTLLISGVITEQQTTIAVVVSESKRLRMVEERILVGADSPRLAADFDSLLERYKTRWPNCKALIASPLPDDVAKDKWQHIGDKPFRTRRIRAIGGYVGFQVNPIPFIPAVAIAAAALGASAFAALPALQRHEQAAAQFAREASLIREGNDYSPADLDLLTRRKQYLDEAEARSEFLKKAPAFSVAVAQALPPVARVISLTVNVMPPKVKDGQKEEQAQFAAVVMVPRDDTKPALDQAHPILETLSAASGYRGRLAINGWRDENTIEGGRKFNWRMFTIEAVRAEGEAR